MKLNDLMTKTLTDLVKECNVVSFKPITKENGDIVKVIVEYEPKSPWEDADKPR